MDIENEIRACILHDMHKIYKRKHDIKEIHIDTTADRDAANMSRPKSALKNITDNYLGSSFVFEREITERKRKEYVKYCENEYINSNESTKILYEKLLNETRKNDISLCDFSEIPTMPYTSLKYHTLLVCALHYNYKKGLDFQDLYLNWCENNNEQYTTIFKTDNFYLVINNDKNGSHIGSPSPYFGQTTGRLNNIPLSQYIIENLRRFRSWSIGLQYLDDVIIKLKGDGIMCNPL